MAKDRIPTSRLARTAKVGTLAAGQAARQLGTLTTNLGRSDEGKQAALERRHLEAAEQIVAALGTMKGAAMKLGQVMSFLDVGLVPEEYREEFQRKLGELRDAAPKVRFHDMKKVIESELGESIEDVFAAFETEPHAHMLVEELMILANEAVAGLLAGRRREALYRVHERPERLVLVTRGAVGVIAGERVPDSTDNPP